MVTLWMPRKLKCRAIWALVLLQILLCFIFFKIGLLYFGSTTKKRQYYDLEFQRQQQLGLNSTHLIEFDFWKNFRSNPVYRSFNIKPIKNKPKVTLLIIVSSAPKRLDRRKSIRETWWQLCKDTTKLDYKVTVKCLFMTDKQRNSSSEIFRQIEEERRKYNDLELQSLEGGVEFGKRYMYHLHWAIENYEFDYFMRMDDDYFLCLDKLINELPMPPLKYFHWGWVHCIPGITRPEESIIMFSYDIIKLFLSQPPDKTYCHPWADQLVATWVDQVQLPIIYHTDTRLHHDPPAEFSKKFKNPKDVCIEYIGVHGSYPTTMKNIWKNRGNYIMHSNDTLLRHSKPCKVTSKFNWKKFTEVWQYEPKLCINNPTWDTKKQGSGTLYKGRQNEFQPTSKGH